MFRSQLDAATLLPSGVAVAGAKDSEATARCSTIGRPIYHK
jgi:hypothetical protein